LRYSLTVSVTDTESDSDAITITISITNNISRLLSIINYELLWLLLDLSLLLLLVYY